MKLIKFFVIVLVAISCLYGCLGLIEGYRIEGGKVYYRVLNSLTGTTDIEVEGADAATFEKLSNYRFGKDKNHVYIGAGIIEGADPVSFRLMKHLNRSGMSKYSRDDRNMFLEGNVVPGAHPDTYRKLRGDYAIDKGQIYWYGEPFSTRVSSFEQIDLEYARDSAEVYVMGKPLNVCSANNFRFLFRRDESASDVGESMSERWATDGCHYYFGTLQLPTNDYANVTVFRGSMGITKDTKTAYYQGRDIRFDVDGNRILDTLDVATFTVDGYLAARDTFGRINVFCGRKACD